jgi:polysaccharide biosynthesis protein PslH
MHQLKSKKILYISNKYKKIKSGGREKLSDLNFKVLKTIYKKKIFYYKISKHKIINLSDIFLSLFGNIDGINNAQVNKIKEIVKRNNISHIFIDGSNLGKLSRKLKNKNVRIISYCHNVESIFFWDKLKLNFSFRNFFIFFVNYLAELQTVYFADYLIFLNNRDKNNMFKYYKKTKFFILPLSLKDNFKNYRNKLNKNNFILFVGGNFYANVDGVKWYLKEILPKINIKTYFIGSGLFQKEYKNNPKVVFKGYVKNLNIWYKKSLFIISPIFYGSGMKTKIAESLMYGKKILGTKESFVGYETFQKKIGKLCNNKDDFIKTINSYTKKKLYYFDSELRDIYINNYSEQSLKKKYLKIMKNIS